MTQDATAALRDLIKMAVEAYEAAAVAHESSTREVERERGDIHNAIAVQRADGRLTPPEDLADLAKQLQDQATKLLERASLAHLRGATPGPGVIVPGMRSSTEADAAAAFAAAQVAAAKLRVALLALARAHLAGNRLAEATVLVNLVAGATPGTPILNEIDELRAAIWRAQRAARFAAAAADLNAGQVERAQDAVQAWLGDHPDDAKFSDLLASIGRAQRAARFAAVAADLNAGDVERAQDAVQAWLGEHPDDAEFRDLLIRSSNALVDAAKSSDAIDTVVSAQAEVLRRFGLFEEVRAVSRRAPTAGWLSGGARRSVFEFGGHAAEIADVAFLDEKTLVSIDGFETKTWSLAAQGSGQLVRTIATRGGRVLCGDGRFACGGGEIWSTEDGRSHATDGPAATFFDNSALSSDGSVLVIPTSSKTINPVVGHNNGPILGDQSALAMAAFSARNLKAVRGKKAMTELSGPFAQPDTSGRVQHSPYSSVRARRYSYKFSVQICSGIQLRGVQSGPAKGWHAALTLPKEALWVDVAASIAKGIVAVMSNDGTVWIVSISSMQISHTLAITGANDLYGMLRVSHSGRLVVGSSQSTVTAWDVASGKVACSITTPNPLPTAVAVSPNDKIIAIGTASGLVRIVDIASGVVRAQWQAHSQHVLALGFSADSSLLASGGDRVVRVWGADS